MEEREERITQALSVESGGVGIRHFTNSRGGTTAGPVLREAWLREASAPQSEVGPWEAGGMEAGAQV